MSYTRKYHHTIHVPLKITLNDPEYSTNSEGHVSSTSFGDLRLNIGGEDIQRTIGLHGSQNSYEIDIPQDIDIEVNVDTDEFDEESENCRETINGLTGSVVATSAAEIASIKSSSRQIADTIVTGFFKQVKSEVSSQIMEKRHAVESRLMHLKQQADELNKKRAQMETDYQRTAARYKKIFDDLNAELENRVKALDKPIYDAHASMETETSRLMTGDYVDISAISSAENAVLMNQIQSCLIKKHASESIGVAQKFLYTQKCTDRTIQRGVINSFDMEDQLYLPVMFMDLVKGKGISAFEMHADQNYLSPTVTDTVKEAMDLPEDSRYLFDETHRNVLKPYLNSEIFDHFSKSSSSHDDRVKEQILKLFNA